MTLATAATLLACSVVLPPNTRALFVNSLPLSAVSSSASDASFPLFSPWSGTMEEVNHCSEQRTRKIFLAVVAAGMCAAAASAAASASQARLKSRFLRPLWAAVADVVAHFAVADVAAVVSAPSLPPPFHVAAAGLLGLELSSLMLFAQKIRLGVWC